MTKNPRFILTIGLVALTLSMLACGVFSAPQATAEPQSAPATEAPVSAPAQSSTDPNATVPCVQIVPADELNNLLSNAKATLVENAYSGGTSCEWKYTPNGGSQANLFYVQTSNDPELWEATRKSELSNEPSDIVVNSIDGLADESYVWSSKVTGLYVVYARKGEKTLIMRFVPQDVLYMANESGIIDMVDRFFSRF